MKQKLSFEETVRMAVNSISEGLITRCEAIGTILTASSELTEDLERSLQSAVMTLDRAVEDFYSAEVAACPLDAITIEEADNIYKQKDMLLFCRNGHALTMFKEIPEEKEPLAVCR